MTPAAHLIEFETAHPDYRNPTIEVNRASLTCLTGSFLVCSFCPRKGLKAMVAAVQLPADDDTVLFVSQEKPGEPRNFQHETLLRSCAYVP